MWNERQLNSHYYDHSTYFDYGCAACGGDHTISKQKSDRESDTIRSLILYGVTDEQMDMLNDDPSLYEFLADFSKWAWIAGY